MQAHQERVVAERAELDDKMDKLSKFLDTNTYYNLSEGEKGRLVEQLGIINQYRDVLDRRIAAF